MAAKSEPNGTDTELDVLGDCLRAIERLDDAVARLRVLWYLLDKYGSRDQANAAWAQLQRQRPQQ